MGIKGRRLKFGESRKYVCMQCSECNVILRLCLSKVIFVSCLLTMSSADVYNANLSFPSLSFSLLRTHTFDEGSFFILFIYYFFFFFAAPPPPPPVGGGAGVGYTQAFSSVTLVGEEIC